MQNKAFGYFLSALSGAEEPLQLPFPFYKTDWIKQIEKFAFSSSMRSVQLHFGEQLKGVWLYDFIQQRARLDQDRFSLSSALLLETTRCVNLHCAWGRTSHF